MWRARRSAEHRDALTRVARPNEGGPLALCVCDCFGDARALHPGEKAGKRLPPAHAVWELPGKRWCRGPRANGANGRESLAVGAAARSGDEKVVLPWLGTGCLRHVQEPLGAVDGDPGFGLAGEDEQGAELASALVPCERVAVGEQPGNRLLNVHRGTGAEELFNFERGHSLSVWASDHARFCRSPRSLGARRLRPWRLARFRN